MIFTIYHPGHSRHGERVELGEIRCYGILDPEPKSLRRDEPMPEFYHVKYLYPYVFACREHGYTYRAYLLAEVEPTVDQLKEIRPVWM